MKLPTKYADRFVISAHIPRDHPERIRITNLRRGELFARIARDIPDDTPVTVRFTTSHRNACDQAPLEHYLLDGEVEVTIRCELLAVRTMEQTIVVPSPTFAVDLAEFMTTWWRG